MRSTVFAILNTEKAKIALGVQCALQASNAGHTEALSLPKQVAIAIGNDCHPEVIKAWSRVALAVIDDLLDHEEMILAQGLRRTVEVRLPTLATTLVQAEFKRRKGLDPAQSERIVHFAEQYARTLVQRIEPKPTKQTQDRHWDEADVRAQIYRRFTVEKASTTALEKIANRDDVARALWERDRARYDVFYTLCALSVFGARQQLIDQLERLRAWPKIPVDLYDREAYRQSWLGAVNEIYEEVLVVKSAKTPSVQPSVKTVVSEDIVGEDRGTNSEVPTNRMMPDPPPVAVPSSAACGNSSEAVLLDIPDETPWYENAAFLGDAREADGIARFRRAYKDFWAGAGHAHSNLAPNALRKITQSLVRQVDDMLRIWNELELYRIATWTGKKHLIKGHTSPVSANEVLAGKVQLCLGEFDDIIEHCRGIPRPENRSHTDIEYREIASSLDAEVLRLKGLVEQRLEESRKTYARPKKRATKARRKEISPPRRRNRKSVKRG